MTEQPNEENPVSELQPLNFRLIHVDDIAAVYQALTVDYTQPEIPVYTVTLTIDANIQRAAGKELQDFLDEMRASFSLLSAPVPEEGSPGDAEPFDIETQVRVELDLVTLKSEELVGTTVTIESSIGSWQAALRRDHTILYGGSDQYYYAYCNRSLTATVTPSRGSGTIRQQVHSRQTNVGVGNPGSLTAPQCIVHSASGMTFTISTNFNSHHGKSC